MNILVNYGYEIEKMCDTVVIKQTDIQGEEMEIMISQDQLFALIRDLRKFLPEGDKKNAEKQKKYRDGQAKKNE